MGKTIVTVSIFCLTAIAGCKPSNREEGCPTAEAYEAAPLPAPYTGWFSSVPLNVSATSGKGLSETAFQSVFGDGFGYRRKDYGFDPSICKTRVGYLRDAGYRTDPNEYRVTYEISFRENDEIYFEVTCDITDTAGKPIIWKYSSSFNTRVNYESVYYRESSKEKQLGDTNRLTFIGPLTIDSISYPNVFRIDIPYSRQSCKPSSINTLFFDTKQGLVRYDLNNGTEWYVKPQ